MNFQAGVHGSEGRVLHVVGGDGGGPDEHDTVLQRTLLHSAVEDIGHREVRKGLRGTEVVDQQPPRLVRRNESITDANSLDAVLADLDDQRRPVQIVPDTHHPQGRKEIVAALDGERHPAEHAILVALQAEVARGRRHVGEYLEIGLGSVGFEEGRLVGAPPRLSCQRVLGSSNRAQSAFDLAGIEAVLERGLVHVEEVSENDRRLRPLDGVDEGTIVVGVLPAVGDEAVEARVLDRARVQLGGQPIDQDQLRVRVGLGKGDVEPDDLRPVVGQDIDQPRDLRARPGPPSLGVEALFVDDRQRHRRAGPQRPPRDEAQIVGLQLDQLEDGRVEDVQRQHRDEGAEHQRGRIDPERALAQVREQPLHD